MPQFSPAVEKRKLQPCRSDEADSYVGNTICQILHPLCHGQSRKQLWYTPNNDKELTGCQSSCGPGFICLHQQPARCVKRQADGR